MSADDRWFQERQFFALQRTIVNGPYAESVFYMGSVSKQFTAASVVLAAAQGYLSAVELKPCGK